MTDASNAAETAVTVADDGSIVPVDSASFEAQLAAHKEAVSLVQQEANVMLTSGDLAVSDQARRIHIMSEAVLFILNSRPPSEQSGAEVVDTGFRESLAEADAKTK